MFIIDAYVSLQQVLRLIVMSPTSRFDETYITTIMNKQKTYKCCFNLT
jgi:hypothetical protein